ncbi:chemotaxis protein CheA [Zymobacter palmae]|uniref:Chemotaxis protein CheA n=1 Tax=Zymobacter palmae TaxID=33074 RepID=A0A348HFK4_9GAMM|nr:chemotaxis protein CheA [Zymobacter palmae]BBG30406.1 chemotaxis protein histidine kinase [Zymobacter palmae]
MDFSAFHETFFDEARELLDEMETLLMELDVDAPDPEALAAIFRAAHSIKGGASTFGFEDLQVTTHLLENLLDGVRHAEMFLDREAVDTILSVRDHLAMLLDCYANEEAPDAEEVASVRSELKELAARMAGGDVKGDVLAPLASEPASQDASVPAPAAASGMTQFAITLKDVAEKDRASLQEELALFGDVSVREASEQQLVLQLVTTSSADDIEAVLGFILDAAQMEIVAESQAEAPAVETKKEEASAASVVAAPKAAPAAGGKKEGGKRTESSTLRVATDKIDQILNLVGELVITQAMLEQSASHLDQMEHSQLVNGASLLQRNVRDLQEAVMSVRMMPMDSVFNRFPRLVRDNAKKLGKEVELETVGHSTELDKGLIEGIVDPLTHLVRNSLDHGIETPEKRIEAGKSPAGHLKLAAYHKAGHIVIEISDDGAGLNREKILDKARSNGMDVNDNMPDDDVWQLIFASGFSTAEKITDLSGRGVGMDVVRRNITNMGGHVSISSKQGQGTTTRILLPLTLAILDGMLIQSGEETFILPLNAIAESIQIASEDVKMMAGGKQVIKIRGEYLPLLNLADIFEIPDAQHDIKETIGIVVQADRTNFVLLVDQLLGQRQVVVKNLETHYRRVEGVSAATILGDGRVALILDLVALSRLGIATIAQELEALNQSEGRP